MRVTERGKHSSEICGNILHYEEKRHILLLARGAEYEKSERQKSEQCHIVRYEHRSDKCDVDKRKCAHTGVFENTHHLFRQHIEKVDIAKSTHNGKYAEKAGQRFEVKIADILSVDRHDYRSHRRREKCYDHYRIFLYKSFRRLPQRGAFKHALHQYHRFLFFRFPLISETHKVIL